MKYTTLRQLYRSRPAFRELFDWISAHGIDESRMTVEEFLDDGRLTRRQTISALRELEDLGCGHFKVGRKGHASRFEWSMDPNELARRLHEGPTPDVVEDDGDPEPAELEVAPAIEQHDRAPELEMIRHVHRLRLDLAIEVLLPKDLTPSEAAVLGDWIRDLSFER